MTTNRSAEELAMRTHVADWGRERWPGARVVHELVIGDKRIDMAFIGRDHIAGVEIKGPKDKLDRLADQMKVFNQHLPEVWLACHPKWCTEKPISRGRTLTFLPNHVPNGIVVDPEAAEPVRNPYLGEAKIVRMNTVPLLHLLWRDEAVAVAARCRVSIGKRAPLYRILPELARLLTGDEIVREVCRELRARRAFPADPPSDPPIVEKVPA